MEPVIDAAPTRAATAPATRRSTSSTRVDVVSFDVDGARELVDRFVAVGQRLQAAVPMRVPMDPDVVRTRLTSAFAWNATGQARHFIVSVDGADIGRCSALLDPAHRDADGQPVGAIGLWECTEDEAGDAAAHALLELATTWLREQGAHDVVGPIDFSTWYGYRFRDGAGDGRDPHLLEPVTPDHAIEQWRRFGFDRDETYFSAEITDPAGQLEMSTPLVRELVAGGWQVRQLRMSQWDDLIDQVHALSMREFTRQPYFTPSTLDEFRAIYEPARRSVDPRYVFSALAPDGTFAGFVFGVRDLGAAQRALARGGIAGRVSAARAAWHADTVMVKTICVAKPYREHGVSILLQAALYRAALATGHTRVCNMLMHANNRSRMLTELAGGVEFRTYVTLRLPA